MSGVAVTDLAEQLRHLVDRVDELADTVSEVLRRLERLG